MALACPELCCLPLLCFSAGTFQPLHLPSSYLSTRNKPSSVFRDIHFIVDKLLMTAYLLFPDSQGKQSPKAITGYVDGEGTADTCVSLSVVLQA